MTQTDRVVRKSSGFYHRGGVLVSGAAV